MKYKEGTIHAGLLIIKNNKRQILCECTKCNKRISIDISSINRKIKFGTSFCEKCITRRYDDNYIYELAMYDYKKKAEERGYEFSLTFDQFKDLVSKKCHYCNGDPFSSRFSRKEWNSKIKINGIDRKDNSKGYTKSNSVTCCNICNKGKNNKTYKEFIEYLERIVEFRK
jgi:hypothetical protein